MDRPTCATCLHWERHDTVSDRHGAVIAMRKEGLTQEEVAHVFRVSSARIRQIEKEKSTGMCRRYPTSQKKAEADFCGEHTNFPAFIESRKATSTEPPRPLRPVLPLGLVRVG